MEDAQHEPRRKSLEEDPNGSSSLPESRISSFDGARPDAADDSTNLRSGANGVLGNGFARQSHPDLHMDTPNGRTFFSDAENTTGEASRRRPGGLQAKSGIIIVRLPNILFLIFLTRHTNIRGCVGILHDLHAYLHIQGIHNLFIVIPQFISTAFTSLIFAIFDPAKSVRAGHNPGLGIPGQGNETLASGADVPVDADVANIVDSALIYARDASGEAASRGANSVAIVFR